MIRTSERPSNKRVPFLCLLTDFTSPICCWRSQAKRQALTLCNLFSSSLQDMSRNVGLLGKPELKKLSKSTCLSTSRRFYPKEEEGLEVWHGVAMLGGPPSRLSASACHQGVKRKDTRNLHGLSWYGGRPPLPEPKKYFRGITLH